MYLPASASKALGCWDSKYVCPWVQLSLKNKNGFWGPQSKHFTDFSILPASQVFVLFLKEGFSLAISLKVGEMAQRLRVLAALPEDPRFNSQYPHGDSSSRESDALTQTYM